MARPYSRLTAKAEVCIRMEARGEDHRTILLEIFGLGADADPKDINNAESQMFRWRHHPAAEAIWQDEVKAYVRKHVSRAMGRISSQINDSNGWLANKAANDIVTMAKNAGILQTEEKALNVKVEGMPDLGSPDEDG